MIGQKCKSCGLLNHFKSKCINKKKKSTVNSMLIDTNRLSLNSVEVNEVIKGIKSWNNKILIENIETEVKLDTGAQINMLPVNFFKKFNKRAEKSIKYKV